MEEEADLIHLDFADIDRQRLEAICNEALSVLTMGR